MKDLIRCSWAGNSPAGIHYHDTEWGVPLHDEKKLFEMLILESMQAGLSWSTILAKREAMRSAFDGFDYLIISKYGSEKIDELLQNSAIIRHRAKLNAMVGNASSFLKVQEKYGSFNKYIWNFIHHEPIINSHTDESKIPTSTTMSVIIAQDLKKKGFKFVGPTTVYAFMQAIGMVNDHLNSCFRK